ncbi:MAG TPA: hypothetical protein VH394_30990, partial [Thermoanaerobaculia bacterium]|nr:hypothetical protein [Thermoanaerobaculia bacterium]
MNRKWMIWMVVPVLLTVMYGCPKKKPVTPPTDIPIETEAVTPTPAPPMDVPDTPAPVVEDQVEDPLMSADMQVVNDELRRRGFSSDVYFNLDDSMLSDESRERLARNAELLKGQP